MQILTINHMYITQHINNTLYVTQCNATLEIKAIIHVTAHNTAQSRTSHITHAGAA